MADMTRYLKPWLTDAMLQTLGGEFEGIICDVTEETLRNPYTAQKTLQPVLTFEETGHRLVLNKTMLQKVIHWFGGDSNSWIGRRVRIYRRPMEIRNRTGKSRQKWQRDIACEDPLATFSVKHRGTSGGGGNVNGWAPPVDSVFDKQRSSGSDDEFPSLEELTEDVDDHTEEIE